MSKVDETLQCFERLTDRISSLLIELFPNKYYMVHGPEGVLKRAKKNGLGNGTFNYPFANSGQSNDIMRWSFGAVRNLSESEAFVPFDEQLGAGSNHAPVKIVERLVDQKTYEHITETFSFLSAVKRGHEHTIDPRKCVQGTSRNLRLRSSLSRPGVPDNKIFLVCLALRKASHIMTGESDVELTKSVLSDLIPLVKLATKYCKKYLPKKNGKVEYDLISSLVWLAAEISELSAQSKKRKTKQGDFDLELTEGMNAVQDVRNRIFSFNEEKNSASGLLPDLVKKVQDLRYKYEWEALNDIRPKLIRSKYLAKLTDQSRREGCEEDYELRFVNYEYCVILLLENSCRIFSSSTKPGSPERQMIASTLAECVHFFVVKPPIRSDLFWQCTRASAINVFLRNWLWDYCFALIGSKTKSFVSELQESIYDSSLNSDFRFGWPKKSTSDLNYRSNVINLLSLFEKVSRNEIYIGEKDDPQPICILLAAPPGSGKSYVVKRMAEFIARKCRDLELKEELKSDNESLYVEINCANFNSWAEVVDHLKRDDIGTRANLQSLTVFFDEVEALEHDNIYARLLPLMWDGKLDGKDFHPGKKRFLFFAGSKRPTCRAFRLFLRSGKVEKGRDFVSRLMSELDIPSVGGLEQYAARGYVAATNLKNRIKFEGSMIGDGEDARNLVTAACLDVSLTSGRAVKKWAGRVPVIESSGGQLQIDVSKESPVHDDLEDIVKKAWEN